MPFSQGTQTQKQKRYCNRFNKDFKNMVHMKKKLKKQIPSLEKTWDLEPFTFIIIPDNPVELKYGS